MVGDPPPGRVKTKKSQLRKVLDKCLKMFEKCLKTFQTRFKYSIAPRIPPGRAKIDTKSMVGGVGGRGEMAETYQKAMFFRFRGYMIKTPNRSNTEPHGVPDSLDRFVGKVVQFSTTWKRRQ